MRAHLTDIAVRSLKPTGRQTKVWDTSTPGFGVIVGKGKSFFVMYGKERAVKILGRYPDTPLSAARTKAKMILSSERPGATSITFDQARQKFLDMRQMRPRSKYELERTLRRHFHWKQTLDKITHQDVAHVIDNISAKSEASHAFKDIRTFFRWCVPRYIPHSPCEGLKMPARYVPRQRVLSDDELRSVWNAANTYPFSIIVKLLILTGQRKGEIAQLHWEWVDEEKRTITFPGTVTKNGREHRIPFGSMTYAVMDSIANISVLTFPGRNPEQPYNGWGKHKAQLDKASGVHGWTLHDLRRTFATKLAALETPIHITERLLNHVSGTQGGIVSVYQRHTYEKECRDAIEMWEKHLKNLFA